MYATEHCLAAVMHEIVPFAETCAESRDCHMSEKKTERAIYCPVSLLRESKQTAEMNLLAKAETESQM